MIRRESKENSCGVP